MKNCHSALLIGIGVVSLTPFVVSFGPYVSRMGSLFLVALIVAAGLHIVTGMMRVISLCHIAFCGVGAYISGVLARDAGVPVIWAILLGAAVAGLVAALLAWFTVKLEDVYLTLATLAGSEILANLFRGLETVTGGANGLIGVPPLSLLGISLALPERAFAFCAIVAGCVMMLIASLQRSLLGKALQAAGDAGMLIEALGIQRNVLRIVAMSASGGLAGLAGAIVAHLDGFVGPESFGVSHSVLYLCYLVLGGLGRLWSIVTAAAFAVLGSELLRGFHGWQMVLLALLVITSLLWQVRRRHQGATTITQT